MDATEMIEIEILDSKIKGLEAEKQSVLEENERLRSASLLREKAQSDLQAEFHLLRSEKQSMETKFSKIILDQVMQIQELKEEVQRVAGERDGLRLELHLKSEEAEQLFLDVQELEKTSQEDQMELGKVMAERAQLLAEKEMWDDRVHKITEDNTVIILTLLTSQSDMEEQMNRKDATMEAFAKKVLEMVRRTRAVVDSRHVPEGGEEGETSQQNDDDDDDDEIGNVARVMAAPVEQELKGVEAGVAAALKGMLKEAPRKEMVETAVEAAAAVAAAQREKALKKVAIATTTAAAARKEKVSEEGSDEEMQTTIAWWPRGKGEEAWRPPVIARSRKGQSSEGYTMKRGKAVRLDWEEWDS